MFANLNPESRYMGPGSRKAPSVASAVFSDSLKIPSCFHEEASPSSS